ncbi:MAG TPA: DUF4421 domain-containing protein [Parasegetibacter sp.]
MAFRIGLFYCLTLMLLCSDLSAQAMVPQSAPFNPSQSAHSKLSQFALSEFSQAAESSPSAYDSAYYVSYIKGLTTRFYFSKKYTSFRLSSSSGNDMSSNPGNEKLYYRPNTTLNMGVGATYNGITLNLAFGFPFLNRNESKGETKYLDLQAHIYVRKYSIDLIGQFYRGYFLTDRPYRLSNKPDYNLRPDLKMNMLGVSVFRVINHRRFSYRAMFFQDEWQKRSAGSLLIGGEVIYGNVKADSAFVPPAYKQAFPSPDVDKVRVLKIGPGIGYGYTLVAGDHIFFSGSATATVNLSVVKEFTDAGAADKVRVEPDLFYRAAVGYNSSTWSVSITALEFRMKFRGEYKDQNYRADIGNYRLNVAKRIQPGKKVKRLLRPLD